MVWERTSSIGKTDLFGVSWCISTDVSRILCIHSSHRPGLENTFKHQQGLFMQHSVDTLRYLN